MEKARGRGWAGGLTRRGMGKLLLLQKCERSTKRVEGDAGSESTVSVGVALLLLLDARHPGNGTHFMIITLILLCCSLVWCKELSYLRARGTRSRESIIFIDLPEIIKQIN